MLSLHKLDLHKCIPIKTVEGTRRNVNSRDYGCEFNSGYMILQDRFKNNLSTLKIKLGQNAYYAPSSVEGLSDN